MRRPLKHYTDEQIQLELAERAKEKYKEPEPVPNPDWNPLINYIREAVHIVGVDQYIPKDFDHYCFEMAIETLYGKDIWKWWNEHASG